MARSAETTLTPPFETVETSPEERAALRARIEAQRPTWVPDDVGPDYDPNPYAYQTERERMPEGAAHADTIKHIMSALDPYVAARGWSLTGDVYILYPDPRTLRKRRIAPDVMISRKPITPPNTAYVLYEMEDPPLVVFEVTSPDSGESDRDKRRTYAFLGVPLFVVVDIVAPNGKLRDPYLLDVWQLTPWETYEPVAPDAEGNYPLDPLGLTVRAEGQRLIFTVAETGERLLTSVELAAARAEAEQRAAAEVAARAAAEARVQELMAELERLRRESFQ